MTNVSEREDAPHARFAAMRVPPADPGVAFHAITLTADARGQVTFGNESCWTGWHGDGHRIEMRRSRVVDAGYAVLWQRMGHPYLFVMDEDDLLVFLMSGGHALVERTLAEKAFPDQLKPKPAYPSGRSGFVGPDLMTEGAERRAPTPKVRMAVLKRDDRRCRICGRRPDDHVDVVLHVHHIRPWAKGGASDMANLITLCHTCHNGLDPHFDRGLFDYVAQRDARAILIRFADNVARYRRATALPPD